MSDFRGNVSGIDVIATPGLPLRCLAFIGGDAEEIQVATDIHALQTALELAAMLQVPVEVSFDEQGPEKKLKRVRLLDR